MEASSEGGSIAAWPRVGGEGETPPHPYPLPAGERGRKRASPTFPPARDKKGPAPWGRRACLKRYESGILRAVHDRVLLCSRDDALRLQVVGHARHAADKGPACGALRDQVGDRAAGIENRVRDPGITAADDDRRGEIRACA